MGQQGATIREALVAVPARNEQGSIAACIRSVDVAARESGVRTLVVVAADSCDDETLLAALTTDTSFATCHVIQGRWGRPGAARAAAVASGLAQMSRPVTGCWIANTDADCTVPPDWLARQMSLSGHFDAVAGVMDLDDSNASSDLVARFAHAYDLGGHSHAHVHAANLGLRGTVYESIGGWCRRTEVGEDHDLWGRVRRAGFRTLHSTEVRVTTSARLESRVEGGFATDLRGLAAASVAESAA